MNDQSLDDTTPVNPGAPTAPSPAVGTSQHPLGNPDGPPAIPVIPAASIVDTILDLDELLSADVRRAEKTARFCTKPWLEADIDELEAELAILLDSQGNPLPTPDRALEESDSPRTAEQVALEIQHLRVEMGQAFRSVRMGQLPDDEWGEFKTKHRETLDKGAPYPNELFDELIAASAIRPPIPIEKVRALRSQLGEPQMSELADKAWLVNTESGVSIPKSPTSLHVLRRAQLARS
jgi:hypothetical protein